MPWGEAVKGDVARRWGPRVAKADDWGGGTSVSGLGAVRVTPGRGGDASKGVNNGCGLGSAYTELSVIGRAC